MKRLFDVLVSSILIVLALPILLILAILIRVNLGSPIIFKQQRPGMYGKPFYLYKFRSMSDERDKEGNLLPNHMRMTKFGNVIRKFSLDELPQLINVLKGDISLVGPRPLLMEYLNLYTKEQARRHEVRPGITGWAQVNGRNAISWEEKFELDVWYVNNHSFILDMKILFLTALKVVRTEGVNKSENITMPKFTGTKSTEMGTGK
ncbi:sugar transferase [Bacillus cereus]|uniref:sugar transferase n=1 Tax=Bacillus cereus group TaxID=86661 RepID=UPI000744CB82|nr:MULTISPECIES: sugar transferase [Bacillus cereus group]ALZ64264.1 putative sugar transferase EpsL [Bacillus cereus]ARV95270.1 sugar transferase [Bacillus thuringiensis]MDZ4490615.1 sugar transferase [Bacillus cereus]MDZ4570076.1 sugar transferase [Bacillus cereus]MDZ4638251.1 sugar transferase [Bacillus cereus]